MSPRLQASVQEAHPEVTFAVLNGRPLDHKKKSREGEAERFELLRRAGVAFDVDAERLRLGRGTVRRDDLVDAAACLVTAWRIRNGKERILPDSESAGGCARPPDEDRGVGPVGLACGRFFTTHALSRPASDTRPTGGTPRNPAVKAGTRCGRRTRRQGRVFPDSQD